MSDVIATVIKLYVGIALFAFGLGVGERMSFVRPRYHQVAVSAALWPLVVAQIVVGKYTGFYLGDWVSEKRTAYRQWKCDHEGAEPGYAWCPDCKQEFEDSYNEGGENA